MAMICLYVDSRLQVCGVEAVHDIAEYGRGHLPRCAKHKSVSPSAAVRHRDMRIFKRAISRHLVSQTEMLHRSEEKLESDLDQWNWWEGSNAGGELEYWTERESRSLHRGRPDAE